jgi:hypothetical protein
VSSGTFTVAFATVIAFKLKFLVESKSIKSLIFVSAVYLIYIDLASEGIERNLSYYSLGTGNPVFNMIEHGFGSVVRENTFAFFSTLSIILVMLTFLLFALRRRVQFWELICIAFPLAGGVFGYTTLTLAIPSVILILSARIEKHDMYPRFASRAAA